MADRIPALHELREQLARAEQEYACAEMIEDTDRMYRERVFWNAEIGRLREEIVRRNEDWSGLWGRPK